MNLHLNLNQIYLLRALLAQHMEYCRNGIVELKDSDYYDCLNLYAQLDKYIQDYESI